MDPGDRHAADPASPAPIDPAVDRTNRRAHGYAGIPGISTGIAPWEALAIWPGLARVWLLVAMVAITQPEFDGAFGRGVQRVLGTLLGVIAAIGLGFMATCPVADAMVGVGIAVPPHLGRCQNRPGLPSSLTLRTVLP